MEIATENTQFLRYSCPGHVGNIMDMFIRQEVAFTLKKML